MLSLRINVDPISGYVSRNSYCCQVLRQEVIVAFLSLLDLVNKVLLHKFDKKFYSASFTRGFTLLVLQVVLLC